MHLNAFLDITAKRIVWRDVLTSESPSVSFSLQSQLVHVTMWNKWERLQVKRFQTPCRYSDERPLMLCGGSEIGLTRISHVLLVGPGRLRRAQSIKGFCHH